MTTPPGDIARQEADARQIEELAAATVASIETLLMEAKADRSFALAVAAESLSRMVGETTAEHRLDLLQSAAFIQHVLDNLRTRMLTHCLKARRRAAEAEGRPTPRPRWR